LKEVVIHDACILIDLSNGRLLEDYQRLGLRTLTTDFVVNEIRKQSPDILKWLKDHTEIKRYSSGELIALSQRRASLSSALSPADASVLFLAQDRNVPLLTNDGKLRRTAEQHNVRVNGIFLIMDALYDRRLTSGEQLCKALELILSKKARLPEKECEKRRDRWGNPHHGASR
jgi:predicted nucleic acid-binding protein